jgi:hypothetical protein
MAQFKIQAQMLDNAWKEAGRLATWNGTSWVHARFDSFEAAVKAAQSLGPEYAGCTRIVPADTPETKGFAYAGSVSSGTMRTEDLIDAFVPVLEALDAKHGVHAALIAEVLAIEDFDSEVEDEDGLLEALFDALNECAPEGYYFGSHEGDGADYGFWQVEADPEPEPSTECLRCARRIEFRNGRALTCLCRG